MLTTLNSNLFGYEKQVKKFKDGVERQYVRYTTPAAELELKKKLSNGSHQVAKPRTIFEVLAEPNNTSMIGPMMFSSVPRRGLTHGPYGTIDTESTYDKDIALVAFPYNGSIEPVRSNKMARICNGSVFVTPNKIIRGCDMRGTYRNLLVLALDLNTGFIESVVSKGQECTVMTFTVKRIVPGRTHKYILITDKYTLKGVMDGKNATVRLSGPETTKVGTNNPEPLSTTENIWEPFEYPAVIKYKENQAKYAAEKAAGKSKKPYNKKPYNKDGKPGYRSDKPKFNNGEKKPYERKPYGDNKKPYTPREGRPKYNNRPDNSDRNYKRDYKQSNTSGENGYSRPYKNDAGNHRPSAASKPSRPFKDAKSVGNKPPQKQQDFNKNGIRRLSSNDRMF